MATSLKPYRDRARLHQDELDLSAVYLTPQELKARWKIGLSTVRDIPRTELPYQEFGRGRKLKRRRYHPADVAAYEERGRLLEERAS